VTVATLNLTRVWVNRIDTGEAVSAQSGIDRNRVHSITGEVRTYAGGRQRAITQAGEQGKFTVTLRFVTAVTVDKLRTWVGVPVYVRDARGQIFAGVFFAVPVSEMRSPADYDVTIDLRTVTVAS
jgi:hypothetical protein